MKFKVQSLRFKAAALAVVATLCLTNVHAATTNVVAKTNVPASTPSTNAITGTDFPSFKIISQRNIFSSSRSGRVASNGPTRKPTKVDTFTLVGTIDYSKGMFAIFDGSSSSFRKTLKVGDAFGDFKISDVELDHVTLSNTNGAETVLNVGSQMRRVDDGEWARGTGPTPQVAKATGSSEKSEAAPAENNSDSSEDSAPSPETNDVLKRLMQKRKAEVKHESE